MNRMLSLALATGMGAVVASSAVFAGEKSKSDEPDPRIGEEVRSICFQDSINGWKPIKGEDDVVLLERGVRDWYRVEFSGSCKERLFRHAYKIGIDTRPGGSCVTPGDVIIVEDSPGFPRRCFIKKIYKWDEDALEENSDDESDAESNDS